MEQLEGPSRIFTCTLRVSYAHCTLGNHVYYARYLDMLEFARGEFFRHLGHTCLALQEQDVVFQITECGLKYLKPARYDDELQVRITLAEVRKVRLRFLYQIFRGNDHLLDGWTVAVCAGLDERPKRIPAELAEAFAPFVRDQTFAGEGGIGEATTRK
jgi:acyl-CoA thioester hydrolase